MLIARPTGGLGAEMRRAFQWLAFLSAILIVPMMLFQCAQAGTISFSTTDTTISHGGWQIAFTGTGPVTVMAKFVVQSKKSIDQYIADAVAEDTPLRSLEVGTEDMGTSAGACDGYPCVFFNAISWRDDKSPLPVAIQMLPSASAAIPCTLTGPPW